MLRRPVPAPRRSARKLQAARALWLASPSSASGDPPCTVVSCPSSSPSSPSARPALRRPRPLPHGPRPRARRSIPACCVHRRAGSAPPTSCSWTPATCTSARPRTARDGLRHGHRRLHVALAPARHAGRHRPAPPARHPRLQLLAHDAGARRVRPRHLRLQRPRARAASTRPTPRTSTRRFRSGVGEVADAVAARERRDRDGRQDAERLPVASRNALPESPGMPGVTV